MTGHAHRCWRSAGICLAAACALGVMQGQARAQSGSAEALYNEGHRLMNAGKLAQACEAFEASNRAQPGAGTYLALGMCRERNHQLASAWSAYKAALARAKDLEKRRFAEAKIAELEPRLSYLTVSVSADTQPAGLTVARSGIPLDPLLWNRALPTDGGEYVIEGRVPGREPSRITVHVPVERGSVIAAVPDIEEPAPPAPVPPAPSAGWSRRRKIAAGSAGVSVAAVAVGVVLGLGARSDHEQVRELCPMPPQQACDNFVRANDLSRSAHNRAIGADVAFGIAGAAAITAGVLWFTGGRAGGRDASRSVAIVPTMAPGGFAVTATRSF